MTTLPYGAWPSPITAAALVEASVGLGALTVDGEQICWTEHRPSEGGRVVIVGCTSERGPHDLLPAPFSARSTVHEYGGGAFAIADGTCFFVNFADQRIWTFAPGDDPLPLTPAPEVPGTVRFADLVVDPEGVWIYAVRERHGVGGIAGTDGVVNDLVRIATDGGAIEVVASGNDFYSSPRSDPDGRRIVFLAWDHPNMPWDATALYAVQTDGSAPPEIVAGGEDEAVSQPSFAPDGTLVYLSDRSGFTALYREDGSVVVDLGADCGPPGWIFGCSSYAFFGDDDIVVAVENARGQALVRVTREGAVPIAGTFVTAEHLCALGGEIAAIVGSETASPSIIRVDPRSDTVTLLRPGGPLPVPETSVSSPEAVEVPGAGGPVHALYYPPWNPGVLAPPGTAPPLVVMSHGGPTSRTTAAFNLRIQYFTSRGIAVVDVNYGGSSGFGRAYRRRLDGGWGIVDVADCAGTARYLAERGRADPARLAIRGGSAGGYTTLCALAFTDTFAVGASHYGISDLVGLATDTHKFEARYLDRLVGPLPEARARYDARSPLLHAEGIDCPVIFFQGLDDHVVPPAQAETLVDALRRRGTPVAYLPLAGEGHGFRRAESIIAVAEAEIAFFGAVLGFSPAGDLPLPTIENAEAL